MRFLYLLFFCIFLHSTAQARIAITPPLIRAVQGEQMSLFRQLINGSAEINARDVLGRTAAHYATSRNNRKALKLLLNNGTDPNLADNNGNTLLDLWHVHKNKKMLKLLHKAGAKPSHTETAEEQPDTYQTTNTVPEPKNTTKNNAQDLFQAAANNDRATAERLLAAGADAKEENDDGKVPFDIAREAEHYALTAILLKAAVGIDGRDKKSWRPLHWAILDDDWDLVREFIREGADISAGRTQNVFDVAKLMESETKLVEVFIDEKGVDATIGNRNDTLLIKAIRWRNAELVKILVAQNADINFQTSTGETALILATWWGHTEIVKLLAAQDDANINIQDNAGETALMKATKRKLTEIVELLVAHNAHINIQNNNGDTALILAAWWGHTELVKFLVAQDDVNIDIQNNTESTALIRAAKTGHTEVVELLVAKNANLILKDMYGKTALDYAEERKHPEITNILCTAQQQQTTSVESTTQQGGT